MLADYKSGSFILIDKPLNWTSFDVVNKIRYHLKKKYNLKKIKVGHAGTLDPLATGLLIICTGAYTKKISEFQLLDKEYAGTIFLGATTPSYDLETNINAEFSIESITNEMIYSVAASFVGNIEQTPPIFSAKKLEGKKAYELARKGKTPTMKTAMVEIKEFEITKIELPHIKFRVLCSKGTYIRSLAHDFGKKLNNGAYLASLVRTSIGDYKISQSVTIEEFVKSVDNQVFMTEKH
jgi:tRNA pseudouridine55 synthase